MYRLHDVEWTREKAIRFWNQLATRKATENSYFSKQVGDLVLDLAARDVDLTLGTCLDFGCGPGFLVEKLIQRGATVEAADFSEESIAATRARLGTNPKLSDTTLLTGLPSGLPDARFDTVFFLETIEHLLASELEPTIAELARVTRPGGSIVITTRNEEDLELDMQVCPDCGCKFHRVQHQTSWSATSLTRFMAKHGFEAVRTRTLTLRPFSRWSQVFDLVSTVLRTPKINLMYVGRRR
jgi:2-polyprenyl-3-methyl-5-hydroxy-6-metoxy-1,4-benzoquinol methylase